MKTVLIDTNVLISAILNPYGLPYLACRKASNENFEIIITQQNISELSYTLIHKLHREEREIADFLSEMLSTARIVPIVKDNYDIEAIIRDISDMPILRTAIYNNVDIIITGDKDFLALDLTKPKILTARQFLQYN